MGKSFKKIVNDVRRKMMQGLTKGISGARSIPINSKNGDVKRVLVCRPNHRLGNLLLMTPLIEELHIVFPNAKVDLFVQGSIAGKIFENYGYVDAIIALPRRPFSNILRYIYGWVRIRGRKYDMAINVIRISSSGRLSTKFSRSKVKLFEILQPEEKTVETHSAKEPVHTFRKNAYLMGYDVTQDAAVPDLDMKLSKEEKEEGLKILQDINGNEKRTIGLFTNATGDKCYDAAWWGQLYEALVKNFADVNIIELKPVDGESHLPHRIHSYYNADVRKVAALLSNLDVFVAADSGIMHLASAAHTPTIGLFKVTDPNTYGPYNQGSVSIDTRFQDVNDCIKTIQNCLH